MKKHTILAIGAHIGDRHPSAGLPRQAALSRSSFFIANDFVSHFFLLFAKKSFRSAEHSSARTPVVTSNVWFKRSSALTW